MLFFMKKIRDEEAKCKERNSGYSDLAAGYINFKQVGVLTKSKESAETNKTDTELFGGVRRLGINHVFKG